MRSIGLRLGIIAVIVVVGFVLRPFVTGDAGNLSVGDCFDPPTAVGETVKDVQHHPCTDAHGAEVFYVGKYAPATDSFPTDAAFRAFIETTCTPAFNAYTGLDYATDTTYDFGWFEPTDEGWGKGDREVSCWLVRVDDGKITGSLKKA